MSRIAHVNPGMILHACARLRTLRQRRGGPYSPGMRKIFTANGSVAFTSALLLAFAAPACDTADDRMEAALAAIPDDATAEEVDGYLMTVDALADDAAPSAAGWTWSPGAPIKAGPVCSVPQGTMCGAPSSQDWCVVLKGLATQAKIPALYVGILDTKCKANQNNACYECWDLANYCSQVGTSCTNIEAQCRCLADKLGQI
jgi:hypothetical protein